MSQVSVEHEPGNEEEQRGGLPSEDDQGPNLDDLARHQRGLNSEETEESNSDTLKEDIATFALAIKEPKEKSHMLEVAKIIYPEIQDEQLIGAAFCDINRLRRFDAVRAVFPRISDHPNELMQYFEADDENAAYRALIEFAQRECEQNENPGDQKKEKRLRAIATDRSKADYSLLHTAAEYLDHQMMNILLRYDAAECVDVFHKKPGVEPQSPLTSAVLADCRRIVKDISAAHRAVPIEDVVEDAEFERAVDTLADNKEYIIQELVQQSQRPVDALCAAIELDDPDLLDYVLSLPKFTEMSTYEDTEMGESKPYRPAINSVGTVITVDAVNREQRLLQQLHPLTMASRYCDQIVFELLLENGAQFDWNFDNNNTVFHDAVLGADTNNPDHLDFFDYLLNIRPDLLDRVNNADETALSLACSLGKVALIEKLTDAKYQIQGEIPGLDRSLFVTAYYGHVAVLNRLLERCPVQCGAILAGWENREENPYRRALKQERSAILRPEDEPAKAFELAADWVGVQERLLNFVHSLKDTVARDNIIQQQWMLTEEAINVIEDDTVRTPMLATLEQLKNDYTFNIPGEQDSAEYQRVIKQNNKILGIMNELKNAAEGFVSGKDPATIQAQLMKCCHHKMYSNKILKLLTVVGSAILGAIIVTGAVVAASIVASGGPAVVLTAGPAAKAGFNGGLVAGAALVGGVGGASISTVKEFGQDIMYSCRLWNIGRVMRNSVDRPADQTRLLGAAVEDGGNDDLDLGPVPAR